MSEAKVSFSLSQGYSYMQKEPVMVIQKKDDLINKEVESFIEQVSEIKFSKMDVMTKISADFAMKMKQDSERKTNQFLAMVLEKVPEGKRIFVARGFMFLANGNGNLEKTIISNIFNEEEKETMGSLVERYQELNEEGIDATNLDEKNEISSKIEMFQEIAQTRCNFIMGSVQQQGMH